LVVVRPILALSLDAWGDIAQLVLAITGGLALGGALVQLGITRSQARQARVYTYSDRFNQLEIIRLCARYTDFWETHSYEEYRALPRPERAEWLVLPNFLEEVAALYNRKLLDRDVAADVLGMYVEDLWTVSLPLVTGERIKRNDPTIFSEWEEMQRDTPSRQMGTNRRNERRRARRKLLRGI
jgi:hypothetical protein